VRSFADDADTVALTPEEARLTDYSIVAFLGAAIVFLLGVSLVVYADRRQDSPDPSFTSDNPAIVVPSGAFSATGFSIGPDRGVDVRAYIDERRRELASVEGTSYAVLSFERYATEAEARRAVSKATDVRALLVAAVGGEPEMVRGSLDGWGQAQREAAAADREEIERILATGTVGDPEFERFYAEEVVRLRRLESSLDPAAPVVFGLVVRAPADDLRAMAAAPGVRLVDPVAGDLEDDADIRGLRPEEVLRTGEPATRP
jgi:hypothetical protein